jgi:hypothetical protein
VVDAARRVERQSEERASEPNGPVRATPFKLVGVNTLAVCRVD